MVILRHQSATFSISWLSKSSCIPCRNTSSLGFIGLLRTEQAWTRGNTAAQGVWRGPKSSAQTRRKAWRTEGRCPGRSAGPCFGGHLGGDSMGDLSWALWRQGPFWLCPCPAVWVQQGADPHGWGGESNILTLLALRKVLFIKFPPEQKALAARRWQCGRK